MAKRAALEAALPAGARIATMVGRFYAMDRDKRWERVSLATEAVLHARGPRALHVLSCGLTLQSAGAPWTIH